MSLFLYSTPAGARKENHYRSILCCTPERPCMQRIYLTLKQEAQSFCFLVTGYTSIRSYHLVTHVRFEKHIVISRNQKLKFITLQTFQRFFNKSKLFSVF